MRKMPTRLSTEQHDPESFAASLPPCPDTGVGVAENQTYRVNGHHYREHEREDDAVATASSDLGLTLYGVFDGEGGRRAVDYAREKFPAEILLAEPKQLGSREGVEDLLLATFEAVERGYMASIDPFLAERAPILADIAGLDEGEASRHFPKEMERLGLINRELSSGVTAVVALVKEQALYVANVGDCRALLVKTDPEGCLRVLQLSVQHDTSNQDECLRLRHLGLDEATLRHIRAPTRCLGDYPRKGGWHDHDQYKAAREEPVLATPDIHPPIPLDASAQFLILCSPGLYLTLEEVYGVSKVNAKLAQMVASQFEVAGSVAGVAQAVVDLVCRHHLDTFTRHEERSFLCRSRQMVASQFEVAGSVAGVAQAVVDLVCRHHLDTFTRHEERSFLCRSRQDITLLIRNFNYPLSGGVPWDEATLDSNSAVSTLPRTQRSVLPLDANGRIAPYVSFAGFYQAVQDYGKQAENPPKAPDDEQQSP